MKRLFMLRSRHGLKISRPIVHWSEIHSPVRKPLAHSDYVDGPIAFFGCEHLVDVHIEAKRKDLALLRYRDEIARLRH